MGVTTVVTDIVIATYVVIAVFVGLYSNEMMNIDAPVNKLYLRSIWAGLSWPLLACYLLLALALNIRK